MTNNDAYPPPAYQPTGGPQQSGGYGQQPGAYGQPGGYSSAGTYGYGQAPMQAAPTYANWGRRVGAALLDGIIQALPATVFSQLASAIASHDVTTYDETRGRMVVTSEYTGLGWVLVTVGMLLSLAVFIWNVGIKQGKTGQSIGKKAIGTRLVSLNTGQPVGVGSSIVREIAHVLDALPCYIGYLWPLWDAKRQTFADKVMKTVVVRDQQV